MESRTVRSLAGVLVLAVGAGCGDGGGNAGEERLSGVVAIDGSSTVAPVSEAVAEEFAAAEPDVRVTVGISGTGGGFQRFCNGETDIADASREIKASEAEACEEAGIEYIELPVAWDGLSVVANPANDFAECLTMEELRRVWEPESTVRTWRDVRPSWPAERIQLYGPGVDSGTFDYFTETVVGEAQASRTDFQASEDDNVLVTGVRGDPYALGYFGYAYYAENEGSLKLLGVDGGEGCVLPSDGTIEDGSYPLARPLYLYVKASALDRPAVREFLRFYMENAAELVPATGYHALSAERYRENLERLDTGAAGPGAGAEGDTAAEPAAGPAGG